MSEGKLEKPARVELGQIWSNPMCAAEYNPQTIGCPRDYDQGDGHMVPGHEIRTANGKDRHWPDGDILSAFDFRGYAPGSSPSTEGRPRPAKGQRWRHVKAESMWRTITLAERDERNDGWLAEGHGSTFFTDVYLSREFEFVDHGSPAPTPVALEETQPAPVVAAKRERCVWYSQGAPGGRGYQCGNDATNARSPFCEPHIVEAMKTVRPSERKADLGTFSLPGTNPPQQRAYFTPSDTGGSGRP